MKDLEYFTNTALLLKRNVLPERESYKVYGGNTVYDEYLLDARKRIQMLNGEWFFKPTDDEGRNIEEEFFDEYFIPSSYKTTIVPNQNPSGAYIRKFYLDSDQIEMENFINFTGIDASFYVWINGRFIGFNKEADKRSEFLISEYVQEGINTLAVLVICEENNPDCNQSGSGIWGDIYVLTRPANHIRNIKYKSDVDIHGENVIVSLELEFNEDPCRIKLILLDPEGKTVMRGVAIGGKTLIMIPNPKLWSGETSNLYTLVLLSQKETIVKKLPIYVAEMNKGELFINHVKVHLAGVNYMKVPNVLGRVNDSYSKSVVMLELARMKQNNINAVNLFGVKYTSWFVELCTKLGIYVIADGKINGQVIKVNGSDDEVTSVDTTDFTRWGMGVSAEKVKKQPPITVNILNDKFLVAKITNKWIFKNTLGEIYIQTELFKKGILEEVKKVYDLDLEPQQSEVVSLEDSPLIPGDYKLRITYRQAKETEAISAGFILGEEVIDLDVK